MEGAGAEAAAAAGAGTAKVVAVRPARKARMAVVFIFGFVVRLPPYG